MLELRKHSSNGPRRRWLGFRVGGPSSWPENNQRPVLFFWRMSTASSSFRRCRDGIDANKPCKADCSGALQMLVNGQKYRFLQKKNQLQRCTGEHPVSFPVHPRTPKSSGSAPSSTRWLLCSTVFLPPLCCRPKSIPFQLLGLWLPHALQHGHREGHVRRRCGCHSMRSSLPGRRR
jgi:hypothetical protein